MVLNPVLDVLNRHPEPQKSKLLALRTLILASGSELAGVGAVQETVKWGQASFQPAKRAIGTPIRIDCLDTQSGDLGLLVHCQTTLVSEWRGLFPELAYEGNRCVRLPGAVPLPTDILHQMIAMAFHYHLRKGAR